MTPSPPFFWGGRTVSTNGSQLIYCVPVVDDGCDSTGEALNRGNGFLGCIDPQPLYTGHYAEDISAIEKVLDSASSLLGNIAASPEATPAQKLSWIQEIAKAVESLF